MTVAATRLEGERMTIMMPLPAEPPRPLFRPSEQSASYPVAALGPVLADVVDAIIDVTQAAPAICANSVLATASLAVQAQWDVTLPMGQRRPTSLFLLTIAASGERKTTADREAILGVRDREADLRLRYDAEIDRHRNAQDAYDAVRGDVLKTHKQDQASAVAALNNLGPAPRPPSKPFILVTEPTIEGLIRLLPESQPTLGLFSSEGGSFIGGHAMSDDAKLRSAARLSALWDGEPIDRVRSTGDAIVMDGKRVALHLMAQPDAARGFLADRTLRDQGILSRLLIAAPESAAGSRMFREPSPGSRACIQRFADLVQRKLAEFGQQSAASRPALDLDAEARQLAIRWHDTVEGALLTRFQAVRGFGAKLTEHAVRIAAVLAAIEGATIITATAMTNGINLANFYAAEVLRLADDAIVSADLRAADRLRQWLSGRESALVHLGEIYQFGPSHVRDKATAQRLMKVLEEHGYVSGIEGGAEIDGHHRRDVWRRIG